MLYITTVCLHYRTLTFNRMGEWAGQQNLFKLCDTYVAYGVRGLNDRHWRRCSKGTNHNT